MNPVTRISPVSDAEAARLADGATLAALADQITATSPHPGRAAAARRRLTSRRLLVTVPIAAALAVAGLVITSPGSPGRPAGPVGGRAKPQATDLSFIRHGRYLEVIVTNPLADARRYRAEFARYGLDISLTLVPASPSLVGTLVYFDGSSAIKPITAVGKCFTGGGGSACPVGVQIPLNFKGHADITFGRAARPGEQYETTAAADAPGEVMHGMSYVGKTVAAVLAMLAARHITVPRYLVSAHCGNVGATSVPGSWYVTDADPWAAGEVRLWVSKTSPAPVQSCAAPGSPAPKPVPTSHAG